MHSINNISRHMDAELQWIVKETVDRLFQDATTVKRKVICAEVGKAVGAVLIERLGEQAKDFTVEEFSDMAIAAIMKMPENNENAEGLAFFAADACLVYSQGLLMGMRSPYRKEPVRARSAHEDYWPFGNEGGFCNPMKLKMMGD